jgi:hypothetical protein
MHQLRVRNTSIATLFVSLRCTIYINSPRIHGGYHMISAFSSNGTAGEYKTVVRAPLLQACSKLAPACVHSTPVFPALLDPCLLWVHRSAGWESGRSTANSGEPGSPALPLCNDVLRITGRAAELSLLGLDKSGGWIFSASIWDPRDLLFSTNLVFASAGYCVKCPIFDNFCTSSRSFLCVKLL